MRKMITAFKVSIDNRIEGPEGYADWVDAWSDDYGLTPQIDACVLGAGMYPGYEAYWSAMQAAPALPLPMTGRLATARELEWAAFAAATPHYVVTRSLTRAGWANTTLLPDLDAVAQLKHAPGRDIYLMGGASIARSAIDAGLVDEVRLIIHPLLAGDGKRLPERLSQRRAAELLDVRRLEGDRIALSYRLT